MKKYLAAVLCACVVSLSLPVQSFAEPATETEQATVTDKDTAKMTPGATYSYTDENGTHTKKINSTFDFVENNIAYDVLDETAKTVEVAPWYWEWACGDGCNIKNNHSQGARTGDNEYNNRGELSIPATVSHDGNTYNVVGVADSAFVRVTGTKIKLPDSITYIGGETFLGYNGGDGYTLTIPTAVTTVGYEAFGEMKSPITFAEGSQLKTVGERAFRAFEGADSIVLPEGVTSIGNSAFDSCSSKLTIPGTVENLTAKSLSGYDGNITEDITFTDGPADFTIQDGILYGYAGGLIYVTDKNVTSITVPEGITTLGDNAFKGFSKLESVTLPSTLTSLGDAVFYECSNLTTINLPDSLISIGKQAFQKTGLTTVTGGKNVQTIGYAAFSDCDELTTIDISGVTSIGRQAFNKCSNLVNVTWPEALESMGDRVFYQCTSLENATINGTITELPESTFEGCESLKSFTLPDGLTTIGESAFLGCGDLEKITLPDSLTTIGDSAFDLTTEKNEDKVWINPDPKLTSINIPETVKNIGENFLGGVKPDGQTALIFEGDVPPTFANDAFSGITGDGIAKPTVYYPAGAKDAYTDASNALVTNGLITAPTAGEESDQAISLTVSPASDSILEGEQATFTVTHTPQAANIVVTNSNDNVATAALVDGVLTVTGKNAGSTTVTLSLQINGYEVATKSVTVSVSEPPYTGKYSYEVFTSVGDNGTVSVDRYATEGDKVTIEVAPDEAYLLDELVVTANGKEVELTDNGDGTYSFTMPSADVRISATFAEDPDWTEPEPEPEPSTDVSDIFIDVAPNAWYKDAVQYAYAGGLMTGVSANEFAPDATTTRGMIVSMLARLEGVESANDAGFADVDDEWYATAVNWAASVGVVNGYEDNTFRPNDAITREQLAAILMNYAAYKGEDVSARASLDAYSDAESVSTWATDTMSWAVAEGYITGMTADTLQPQGSATRAQVAAILQRFLENA